MCEVGVSLKVIMWLSLIGMIYYNRQGPFFPSKCWVESLEFYFLCIPEVPDFLNFIIPG